MPDLKYYNCLSDNGVIYSVDMIRLKLEFFYRTSEKILHELLSDISVMVTEHINTSFNKYRHLLVVQLDLDVSFSIGLGYNGTGKTDYKLGFIEFNPNKCCHYDFFNSFVRELKYRCTQILISRWDMAVDISYPRNRFKLHKGSCKYERLERGSLTEYLRDRNSEGRFKLYDKRYESNLNYDLTRAELTIDGLPDFDYVLNLFPKIDFFKNQFDMDMLLKLSQNDLVLLKLLIASDDFDLYYNQLSRRKRERLSPYLFDNDLSFRLSRKCYNHCTELVHSYEKFRILK